MSSEPPRAYGSSAYSNRDDVPAPAPGQAYFGYPQPSRTMLPGPQRPTSERLALGQSPSRPDPPGRAPRWPHFVGYPLAVVLGMLIAVALMLVTGVPDGFADQRASTGSETTASSPPPVTVTPSGQHAAPGAHTPAFEDIPGEGTFIVGSDVEPGRYLSAGGTVSCYWARLSDVEGGVGSTITTGTPKGSTTVTIKKSDAAFETTGCSTWIRQAAR
jgi:hypothetical protein